MAIPLKTIGHDINHTLGETIPVYDFGEECEAGTKGTKYNCKTCGKQLKLEEEVNGMCEECWVFREDEDVEAKEFLKEKGAEKEREKLKPFAINWKDDEFWDSWDKIKPHMNILLGSGGIYDEEDNELFFIGHAKDKIKGKLQLIEQNRERIPLVKRYVKEHDIMVWDEKKAKNIKTGDTELRQKYIMIGDTIDGRSSGICKEVYSEDMNIYQLVDEHKRKFIVFAKENLPNCSCELEGMIIEMSDNADITKNLKIPSITRAFIMKTFDPSVKVLTKEQIIEFTKARDINIDKWDMFLGYHKIGSVNRYSPEFTRLRSAWLLSGEKDGSPLHISIVGVPGSKKSAFLESIGFKFSEDNILLEGGNSTLKMLKPSFKEKPATLGYYANSERVALVDEIWKMVENESVKSHNVLRNIFGDCNFLFDHKERIVGSGNNNTCTVKATFKNAEVSNPVGGFPTISHHIGVIDPTNMSRKLIWVQDEDETDFLFSPQAIIRLPRTPTTIYTNKKTEKYEEKNNNIKNIKNYINIVDCVRGNCVSVDGEGIPVEMQDKSKFLPIPDFFSIFSDRDEFLTLYDTLNSFICDVDINKVNQIYNSITQLAREPMKNSVWRPRGDRHTFLLIDGLCKERCLFQDYDSTFTPKQEDYDMAERILVRMVKSWDTDLSPKENIK